jgi:anti-anti-sigma factor
MLTVTLSNEAGAVLCHVEGDLDAYGVGVFRQETSALAGAGAPVVIDLGRAGFIDGAGLGALVSAVRRCHEHHVDVTIRARRTVARALATAGFEAVAPVREYQGASGTTLATR